MKPELAARAVKERPILFSAPMVTAILDGRKVQTRRIAKEHPPYSFVDGDVPRLVGMDEYGDYYDEPCPHGAPGDRLWLREAFRLRADQDDKPPSQDYWKDGAWYQADDPTLQPSGCGGGAGKLRPSIHMPRWASRIDLEIAAVRVERLQEITEEDARAEGVTGPMCNRIGPNFGKVDYRSAFEKLWDSINSKRAPWSSNCWVWVIEFRRVRP